LNPLQKNFTVQPAHFITNQPLYLRYKELEAGTNGGTEKKTSAGNGRFELKGPSEVSGRRAQ